MPIEFYCPGCGKLMRTPDNTAGRKGRCPTCQLKMQIPMTSVTTSLGDAGTPNDGDSKHIRFDCGGCGKTLSIPVAKAGKKGKCLNCGQLMAIPASSPPRWRGSPANEAQAPDGT